MTDPITEYCAFSGKQLLGTGPLAELVTACQAHAQDSLVNIYDLETGRVVDIDWRGDSEQLSAWLQQQYPDRLAPRETKRGRGRPRLGVVSKEVTLLPRHWEWLASQPGGASVSLRRLIEEARVDKTAQRRLVQDAIYRFATALAGDEPGFEEAMRALYADDSAGFDQHTNQWSADVQAQTRRLAERYWPESG
ncbi:MAG: DUF2239 family protein [Pseudomonadota bacterium]